MQSAVALRSPAARLATAASRHRASAVHHLATAPVRAQAEGEKKKDAAPAPSADDTAGTALRRSAASPGALQPSWGRMSQTMRQLESEMDQLSRAFGMPSFFGPGSSFPSAAASAWDLLPSAMGAMVELPAVTKSLAVDVKDTGKELVISADVPGMTKGDIKVQVSPDRVLTISGERRVESSEGSEAEGNLRVERSFGSFVRRFRLPENADLEGIKAATKDGVLTLTVPKTEESKPKEIEVAVEGA